MSLVKESLKLLALIWGWRFFKAAMGVWFLLWMFSK
jgi:hypothetical protein